MTAPTLQMITSVFHSDITLKSWRAKSRKQSGPVVFSGGQRQLFDSLLARVLKSTTAREKILAGLCSRSAVHARAAWARKQLLNLLGLAVLPPRTPLQPRVRPGFNLDGVRVEHIVFESQPQLFVTANLYLPEKLQPGAKIPAVLHCCGHAPNGKAHYQATSAGLALHGIAVLAFDPAGQGERDEYADRTGARHTVARACRSHGVAGDPMYLTGANFGGFRIFDAMRALDYLQSRPEIDPKRLGVTGTSGGGWESLWLAAIDPRIKAVNSNCYATTLRRKIENRAADAEPDPEQDPFGMLELGLDTGDVILACLPATVSLGATIFDFFPIDGALECYREASGLFELAGYRDRLSIEVSDAGHELTPAMRRQTFGWMRRWLRPPAEFAQTRQALQAADGAVHPEWIVAEARTHCTESGIVLRSLEAQNHRADSRGEYAQITGVAQTAEIASRTRPSSAQRWQNCCASNPIPRRWRFSACAPAR